MEDQLVGYSNINKSYCVYKPATSRIIESRNSNHNRTPSRLLPRLPDERSTQTIPLSSGIDDHNYVTDDDVLEVLTVKRRCSVLDPFPVHLQITSPRQGSYPSRR